MRPEKTFLCIGPCQRSSIPTESVVRVECGAFHLQPGDLAVFANRGHYACHRILYRKRHGELVWYFLSSDHGPPDGWVPAYQMEGRVVCINQRPVPRHGARRTARLWWGRFRRLSYDWFWSKHPWQRFRRWMTEPLLG